MTAHLCYQCAGHLGKTPGQNVIFSSLCPSAKTPGICSIFPILIWATIFRSSFFKNPALTIASDPISIAPVSSPLNPCYPPRPWHLPGPLSHCASEMPPELLHCQLTKAPIPPSSPHSCWPKWIFLYSQAMGTLHFLLSTDSTNCLV